MSNAQPKPLPRRIARVGGLQLTAETSISVWGCAGSQGASRHISIDVHHAAGFCSIEIPTGLAQHLEKLLRAAAFMAEAAGEMSAEEWAKYEAAESASAVPPRKEGGAA